MLVTLQVYLLDDNKEFFKNRTKFFYLLDTGHIQIIKPDNQLFTESVNPFFKINKFEPSF